MGQSKRHLERQMDEEWSSVGKKFACPDCFDDYAIKRFVKDNAVAPECSYCENTSEDPIAAEMDEVISFISAGIHREYEDPVHGVGWDSSEGGYQLAVQDAYDLLYELEIHNNDAIFNDLVQAFSDHHWVQKDPYGELPCDTLRYSWEAFCEQVKHQTRFVFYKLKTRRGWDNSPEPYEILEGLSGIVEALDLLCTPPAGFTVVRARQHSSANTYTTAAQLGTAPKECASQSRMSPAGIPVFYGALDENTAFNEICVAEATKDTVTFGVFKSLRPLVILDLSRLPGIPSMFDEGSYSERMPLIFMHQFVRDATKPVTKDGMEHIEYVPTQIVAEHFRHVFKLHDDTRLDGIVYRSSKNPKGICVALFCNQDDCTDDAAATGKTLLLAAANRKSVDIKNLTFY